MGRITFLFAAWAVVMTSSGAANTVTMNFFGDVDFSLIGGQAANTFSGTLTWDPTTISFDGLGDYRPAGGSFIVDGTDISGNIDLTSSVISISAGINPDPATCNPVGLPCPTPSQILWRFVFSPFASIPAIIDPITSFVGAIDGPWDMFTSNALPTDVSFVQRCLPNGTFCFNASGGVFRVGEGEFATTISGPLFATAPPTTPPGGSAPEPDSVTLTTVGFLTAALWLRRRRTTQALVISMQGRQAPFQLRYVWPLRMARNASRARRFKERVSRGAIFP